MKIASCFKVSPDLEMLTFDEWRESNGKFPETKYLRNVISSYDESALELALRAREQSNCTIALEAVTVKHREQFYQLNTLFAVGYDVVTEIARNEDFQTSSQLVSHFGKNFEKTCIIMGEQSIDNQSGSVPYKVAEQLKIPCVSGVQQIQIIDDSAIKVIQVQEERIRELKVELPCVIVVGDVPKTYLRIPTLKQKLGAKGKEVNTINLSFDTVQAHKKEGIELKEVCFLNHAREGKILTTEEFQKLMSELAQKEGEHE